MRQKTSDYPASFLFFLVSDILGISTETWSQIERRTEKQAQKQKIQEDRNEK